MNKIDFLSELEKRLDCVCKEERDKTLVYYGEMIDDRVEDGLTEEQAVLEIGTPQRIAEQIMLDLPLKTLVKNRLKPKRALGVWEIILIVLGSPIWLSLMITAVAVVISLYAVLWAVLVVFYAVGASLAIGGLVGVVCLVVYLIQANVGAGLFMLGTGLVCAGIAALMIVVNNLVAKGLVKASKAIFIGIKSCFIKKGVKYEKV
ncbi:MAG: DUF1700 domain-containing protein [Clostridia bacterium]|nr:DUF1700 domain-containing protein [Clostridia bacterium]